MRSHRGALFVFLSLLSPRFPLSFPLSLPPTLPSSLLREPAPAAASFQTEPPLRTVQRVQMSGSARLKAISFVELCGLFFPPETGSAWAQHLGDKLDLI